MSVDGMDSIFSIALGLGLRLILGSASNHDPRVAGTLVGLWEGVVLYHFLDKFPGSVDPYVGLAVRLFVDLLATASFVRLAIVLLWTFLGLVIADITPAFWYDRSLRRFVRRTRRYLRSFEWPEMPSSLAEIPRWKWRLPWLSTLSTMPSRVRFFHIPPRTRSNPDPHIEPVSPSAVADITVPPPAPAPAPAPALRRRSIPTAPAPVTSTTSTTFTTSTTGSNNVILAASSLPSALRRTNSSSKSSSSVSFDIERGRPMRALNPPMPSLAVHTATGAPSLPHNTRTQFAQMPVPTIPMLDDPAPPSLRPPTISPISIPMATMPTPQTSASASAPALGPIPLILPTTMPEPHIDVNVPSVDDLPEIPPLSARADREMAFPDLAPKSADEEPPPPFSKLDPLEPHARVRRPSNTNEKSALPGERFSVISDGTRDSIVGRADVLRQEARAEEQERDRLRLERQVASGERRYADALRLKVEAEEAHERSVNLHRRADARYFKAHNLVPEPFTVDLHRLGVPEARRQMEKAIRDALISGGRQVRVIVGRGLHSVNGMPVLKERMQDALQQHHFLFEDDPKNPGVIVVSLPVG